MRLISSLTSRSENGGIVALAFRSGDVCVGARIPFWIVQARGSYLDEFYLPSALELLFYFVLLIRGRLGCLSITDFASRSL